VFPADHIKNIFTSPKILVEIVLDRVIFAVCCAFQPRRKVL